MSFIDRIDVLFPEQPIRKVSDLPALKPKKKEAHLVTHRPGDVPGTQMPGWGDAEDFPRDKEGIAESRDWIMAEDDGRWAPSPSDYSPHNKAVIDRIVENMRERIIDCTESVWVPFAMKELERTGARCAIPSDFKFDDGYNNTIYVGLPEE